MNDAPIAKRKTEWVLGPNRHPDYQSISRAAEVIGSYAHPGHWTCFHCGESFVNPNLAAWHFGANPMAAPGCMTRLRNGERQLLVALREAEANADTLRAEVERLTRERDGYVSWLNNLTFFESDGETERSLNVVWEGEDSYIEAGDEIFSDMKARVEALEKAGRGILDRMFDTYKAGNGRDVGIQGDDGEKCWIVHSDEIAALRAALGAQSWPAPISSEARASLAADGDR